MNESRPDVLGRRVGAGFVDLLLMTILFVVMAVLFGDARSTDGEASVNLDGLPALSFFAIMVLYYGVLESTSGQTLGKLLFGVRVVNLADGSRPATGAIVARTLLRLIDILPVGYIVGLVAVIVTGDKRQRLGDLAGGTTVTRAERALRAERTA